MGLFAIPRATTGRSQPGHDLAEAPEVLVLQ